jgi:hypothetical protein
MESHGWYLEGMAPGVKRAVVLAFLTVPPSAIAQSQLRFPVIHMHTISVCYGYLSVTADSVRFEVVRPTSDRGHSFAASARDLQSVQRWTLFGQPQEVAELRLGRSTYRFKVLVDTASVATAQSGAATITTVDALLAALRDPAAALASRNGPPAPSKGGEAARPISILPPPPSPADTAIARPVPMRPVPAPTQTDSLRAPASGALDGVYAALVIGTFSNHVEHRFLVFYPDGWVLNSMPEGGLEGFNFAAFAADTSNRGLIARYRVDGEQVNMVWQDWAGRRDVVRHQEGTDVGAPNVYVPMCRCDGERFSGTYLWDYQSGIEFTLDGTFVDRGVIDQLDTDLGQYNQPRVRRGTYRIHNYSLYMDFEDGQHRKTSFAAPAFQQSVHHYNWIAIYRWQILHRRGYQPPP